MTMAEWPDEKTQRLKQLWCAGYSLGAIVKELPASRGSIAGKLSRLHLFKSGHKPSTIVERTDQRKQKPESVKMAKAKPAKVKVAAPVDGGITIDKLTACTCHWPLWSDYPTAIEPRIYCGRIIEVGAVYCAEHHRINKRPK